LIENFSSGRIHENSGSRSQICVRRKGPNRIKRQDYQ
jgi:hypothetical protein